VGAWNEAGRAFASALEESGKAEDVGMAMAAVELLRVEVVDEGREDEADRILPPPPADRAERGAGEEG
jgi:hypothetical protein